MSNRRSTWRNGDRLVRADRRGNATPATPSQRAPRAPSEAETLRSTIGWYADLERGSGAAEPLGAALRSVLREATADIAEEQARREHAEREARAEAQRAAAAERDAADRQTVRAQADQQVRQRAERRSARDIRILVIAAILCVTVGVPWLIGAFAIRAQRIPASPFLDALGSDVQQQLMQSRMGDYFLTDWEAGSAVLLTIAALCVLLGSWRRRVGRIICACLFLFVGFNLIAPAFQSVAKVNATIPQVAATTPYPFDDHYASCGGMQASIPVVDDGDQTPDEHLVQVYTARVKDTVTSGCNRVDFWDGWRHIGSFDLSGNDLIDVGATENSVVEFTGSSLKSTGGAVITTGNQLVGATAADPGHQWKVALSKNDKVELTAARGVLLVTHRTNHTFLDVRTGQTGKRITRFCVGGSDLSDVTVSDDEKFFTYVCSGKAHRVSVSKL